MNIGILLLTHNDIGAQLLLAAKSTYGSIPFRTELLSIDHYDQPTDLIKLAQQYVRDKDGNAVAVESMYGTKEESDVDVALNLQAESQRGK